MELVHRVLTTVGVCRKPPQHALTTLYATILIAWGKVNFTTLSRYSDYSERTYRRFFDQSFDFAAFNAEVVKAAIADQAMIAVMDCSFIAKSGK
ncbi:hypothetical protein ACKFKG_28615, partial [Phormidesmis sp. 146-35]